MIRSSLFQRLTFGFAMGWRHLDKERYLGPIKVTPRKKVQSGDQWGDGDVFIQHVRVPSGIKGRVAAAALVNTMSGNYCRHEHDCCGCQFRVVTTKQLSRRDFAVRTQIRINR